MDTSTCPACGRPSCRIIEQFRLTFPPPVTHVQRYQCDRMGCQGPPDAAGFRRRTFWDIRAPLCSALTDPEEA